MVAGGSSAGENDDCAIAGLPRWPRGAPPDPLPILNPAWDELYSPACSGADTVPSLGSFCPLGSP